MHVGGGAQWRIEVSKTYRDQHTIISLRFVISAIEDSNALVKMSQLVSQTCKDRIIKCQKF